MGETPQVAQFIARDCGYADVQPIEPEDEKAALRWWHDRPACPLTAFQPTGPAGDPFEGALIVSSQTHPSPPDSLPARISKIEQALAAVETPDQAKQVIAIADAAIAYAKSLGREFVDARRKAEALKLDAERRLGEFLRAMPKAIGGRPTKTPTKSEGVSAATVAELGIDYKTSARVQKLAELPAETVEAIKAGELSVNQAIAPKPAAPKVSEADTLKARIAELEQALTEARDAAADAGALAQDLLMQIEGEADKRLEQLRAELKATQVTRDIALRENAALKREVKRLQRQVGVAQ